MSELGPTILHRFLRLDPHDAAAHAQLAALLDAAREAPATTRLRDLDVSWFPTARFAALRFVDATELPEAQRDAFARPCAALPELAAVFVDPDQLSYHCFENVVGLDRLFMGVPHESLRLRTPMQLAPGVLRLDLQLDEALAARLASLDRLGLLVPPRGRWRGGRRFVFHAAPLADALTAALLHALPSLRASGFVHVNPVFRFNHFEPDDADVTEHVDSPFASADRSLVSKQSLLLYLGGGRNDAGVLRFTEGPRIDELAGPTALVFDHALAHAGSPFESGPKLFVRSELIHRVTKVEREPDIGALFAKACWLEGQRVLDARVEQRAHELYDRAAKAHFLGPQGTPSSDVFVHREFAGVHFVTNGYDGFFRSDDLDLPSAAALMLLELLHATIDGVPFRRLCTSEVLERSGAALDWIAPYLAQFPAPLEPPFGTLDKASLFPPPGEPDPDMGFPGSPDFAADPFPEGWKAHRSKEVIDRLRRAQRWASHRIFAAPITLVGKQVFLDRERFVITSDRIEVLSHVALGPLHFAGAEFFGGHDFLDVDVEIAALHPLVPPMWFRRREGILHLACDLFRNDWLVGHRHESIPIPYVVDHTNLRPNQDPWLEAAARGRNREQLETELDEALE